MWPSIRRWPGWAANKLWPFSRPTVRLLALRYGYERNGLVLLGQPIPWCADSALVDAVLELHAAAGRRKADFVLQFDDGVSVVAHSLRSEEDANRLHVRFRLPTPKATMAADVLYRGGRLARIILPHQPEADFLAGLTLRTPAVLVRIGEELLPCRSFVARQCRGLLASAVLSSEVPLLPLLDVDCRVEFHCERTGRVTAVPVRLAGEQLAEKTVLVGVMPPHCPRRPGPLTVRWIAGDRVLAQQRMRGISRRTFLRSLRIQESRFVLQEASGCRFSSSLAGNGSNVRAGPCFVVRSAEPGMVGRCRLQVRGSVPSSVSPRVLFEQRTVISDAPVVVMPGTVAAEDLAGLVAFELTAGDRLLGGLPFHPVPLANFTSEGGFQAPEDYSWSIAAEEEMSVRLSRLLERE